MSQVEARPTPVKNAFPVTVDHAEFFGYLTSAELIGHLLHYQSDRYGEHKALNKFYDEATEQSDSVVEAYQGAFQEKIKTNLDHVAEFDIESLTSLEYLIGLRKLIQDNRYDIIPKENTNIHNELDNFVTSIDSAVYKITFLK